MNPSCERCRAADPSEEHKERDLLIRILTMVILWSLALARPTFAQVENPERGENLYGGIVSILSNEDLVADADRGLKALYNMRFDVADSIFSRIDELHPGHPIGPFLKALVVWWRILPNLAMGASADDEAFLDAMRMVIERSDALLEQNPENFDAMFFKGAALGFRGRLRSNRRQWLLAAADGRKTLDYIFRIADADTTNGDFQFGKGVYDYFASVIPDRYPLVRPMMLFFPKADRERGLAELEFTATEGRFIKTEAAYFLLQIHLFYEPDFQKAYRYAMWLRNTYPENAYFHVLEGRVFARWSQWTRSATVFTEVVARFDRGQTGYSPSLASQALYFLGRREMQGGRFEEALAAFARVSELSDNRESDTFFGVNAVLRSGMIYDMQGRREEALRVYERVLSMDDRGNSRDRAKEYRKNAYFRF